MFVGLCFIPLYTLLTTRRHLGKVLNTSIRRVMGQIVRLLLFYNDGFDIKLPMNIYMPLSIDTPVCELRCNNNEVVLPTSFRALEREHRHKTQFGVKLRTPLLEYYNFAGDTFNVF